LLACLFACSLVLRQPLVQCIPWVQRNLNTATQRSQQISSPPFADTPPGVCSSRHAPYTQASKRKRTRRCPRPTTASSRTGRSTRTQHVGSGQHDAENCNRPAPNESHAARVIQTHSTLSAMASAAYFLAAALAVVLIVRSIRTYLSLKQFGGHWSAGWSRLWLLKTQSSGEMHKRFAALNREHGEYSTRHGFFSLPLCW